MAFGPTFPSVLAAARAGGDSAWAAIHDELAPALLGYLRARGAAEPEDVLAETLLQVVRDLPRFDGGEGEFRAWAFRIARNRLLDERRRRARRPVDPHADPGEPGPPAPDAAEEALGRIDAERVRSVLAQLSADQRDVLLLRLFGDLTVEQVAELSGRSAGAVKQLQRRGLAAARRALERGAVTLSSLGAL
ncbi:MAG: sigma-70 family RNA polymerase sigma factor [Thermoleophilaceae bacterium]